MFCYGLSRVVYLKSPATRDIPKDLRVIARLSCWIDSSSRFIVLVHWLPQGLWLSSNVIWIQERQGQEREEGRRPTGSYQTPIPSASTTNSNVMHPALRIIGNKSLTSNSGADGDESPVSSKEICRKVLMKLEHGKLENWGERDVERKRESERERERERNKKNKK